MSFSKNPSIKGLASACKSITRVLHRNKGKVLIRDVAHILANAQGISYQRAYMFVSHWANDYTNNGGYHVKRGIYGGIVKGKYQVSQKYAVTQDRKKRQCPLCHSCLQKNRWEVFQKFMADNPKLQELLSKKSFPHRLSSNKGTIKCAFAFRCVRRSRWWQR
jgi:hypothetical protein